MADTSERATTSRWPHPSPGRFAHLSVTGARSSPPARRHIGDDRFASTFVYAQPGCPGVPALIGAIRALALVFPSVDVAALEAALRRLDGKSAIVVANAGTVNTVDYDTLPAIAALKARYPFWPHADAAFGAFGAFGAFTALSPEHASLTRGLVDADSICIDLHKWLNVPYDAAVQFSRRRDLQVRVFQNSAAYLGVPAGDPDFVHLMPENSRRLRALSTWFALAACGRDGHAEIVRRNIALARRLGRLIDAQPGLTLLAPTRLNVVCFTLAEQPDEARVNAYMRAVRDLGDAFITTTVYAGTWGLRAAFSNWRTDEDDVDRVFRSLVSALG
ncbi:pyridoxal phosphate-dependent decarboxylase family protein [Burkholderia mayonis]|uniref:pyridoxal phosphate-dependent decarboxylase family protein n=1 Tax=Burkholderia mayonis TaxID=1385591 RepID=UPI000AE494C1|nr:pyridoxal-dependent decarboxylase [Burkholderia mayonis]